MQHKNEMLKNYIDKKNLGDSESLCEDFCLNVMKIL
jgi:hypothetical protein